MTEIKPELVRRIETLLGKLISNIRSIQRGYTPALRLVITYTDGSTAFAKVATTDLTASWLRREHAIYTQLSGRFMPHLLGWQDDPAQPILLLEDLSHAYWPPPWTTERIDQVLITLDQVSMLHLDGQNKLVDAKWLNDCWQQVADDPAPFLSLGLASEAWLKAALPSLLSVKGQHALHGDALLHLDVRSDNICFRGEQAVLIDWNATCLGNALVDIAAWLPSLEVEGGPRPETILPDAGDLATLLSGYFAAHAGLPLIANAPGVRGIQLKQLQSALPWAIRELGLPPLDGVLKGGD